MDFEYAHKVIEEDLVNLKKYPETMYMDIYGNGCTTWDRADKCPSDVVFRAKYIRADIVAGIKHKSFQDALEVARKEIK